MNKSRFLILVVIVIVELIFISGVSDHAFCQSGQLNGHEYVDLGLPSGLLWATCNVGANKPQKSGNYYAWGETSTKRVYNEETYKFFDPDYNLTKYNYFSYDDGKLDRLTTLEDSDDVVKVNWGSDWRMPTWDEIEELYSNCTHEWTTMKGVKGRLFTGPNGNSIFLPAAGFRYDSDDSRKKLENHRQGIYRSSSLSRYVGSPVCGLFFDSDNCSIYDDERCLGGSVRAVCQPKNYIKETFSEPTGYANGYGYIDLGLPSGTKWAICNVGALKPSDMGYHFAWGETKTKTEYGENYEYNVQSITLLPEADAATANMGADWRMPTETEMNELINNCTITKVIRNGVIGRLFTGPNGNSIFLPAAGRFVFECNGYNMKGSYWSSSGLGFCILFGSEGEYDWCYVTRIEELYCGFSVRAVYVK